MIVGTFTKQPNDRLDFDVDANRWLTEYDNDTIASVSATVNDPGLTLISTTHNGGIIKQWVEDGTSGVTYKVTIMMVTTAGRELEIEVKVKVKEV